MQSLFRIARLVLPKAGLMAVGLLLAILAAEAGTRLIGLRPQAYPEPVGAYRRDAALGYDISPNLEPFNMPLEDSILTYSSNSIGCFDDEVPPGFDDPYILLVGDSFTWGFAAFKEKYGTVLQDALGMRVMKCGVVGYGTKGELEKARQVMDRIGYPPALLLVGYVHNDLANDHVFPGSTVVHGRLAAARFLSDLKTGEVTEYDEAELDRRFSFFSSYCKAYEPPNKVIARIQCLLKRHSVLYLYVKDQALAVLGRVLGPDFYLSLVTTTNPYELQTEYLQYLSQQEFPWLANAWDDHLGNLDALAAFARERKTQLAILNIPYKEAVYPALEAEVERHIGAIDVEQPSRLVDARLDALGVPYVDLLPVFRDYARKDAGVPLDSARDLYWRYDAHFSNLGNRLTGLLAADFLLERHLVDEHVAPGASDRVRAGLEAFPR